MAGLMELDGPRFGPAAGGEPQQLVILLHGLGVDGQDLIGLAPHLAQVLPNAAFAVSSTFLSTSQTATMSPYMAALLAMTLPWYRRPIEPTATRSTLARALADCAKLGSENDRPPAMAPAAEAARKERRSPR